MMLVTQSVKWCRNSKCQMMLVTQSVKWCRNSKCQVMLVTQRRLCVLLSGDRREGPRHLRVKGGPRSYLTSTAARLQTPPPRAHDTIPSWCIVTDIHTAHCIAWHLLTAGGSLSQCHRRSSHQGLHLSRLGFSQPGLWTVTACYTPTTPNVTDCFVYTARVKTISGSVLSLLCIII